MNIFFRSCLDYFDSIPLLNSDSESEKGKGKESDEWYTAKGQG